MSKERLEEAIRAIKSNWPDERYSLLRDALDYVISEAKRVQELDDIIEQDHRQEVLESMYDDNQRLKKRVRELEGDKKSLGDLIEKTAKSAWDIEQQNKRYQKILTLLNDKEKLATEFYKENENLVMFTPGQVIDFIFLKIDRLESESE